MARRKVKMGTARSGLRTRRTLSEQIQHRGKAKPLADFAKKSDQSDRRAA